MAINFDFGSRTVLRSAVFSMLLCSITAAQQDVARVLPAGQLPNDRRLESPKDLDGHFPFEVPVTVEAWQERSDALRRRVLVATGLWPMPERTDLKPTIHGKVERDGFTVEKVYFESIPNHFVTGLLFRPAEREGPLPAVLCPHGHGGRLQDYGEQETLELITQGAERFEDCGRYPKLSRCAQLARMGCVTFIFDMLGYADSRQISFELAHRFADQRSEFDAEDSWGFFSTQAELRLQSVMGLQTWNSVRALDFLTSLPDVDPNRVGVTGGSGGGTQTILLCAIDPRPVAAFPQGMVSTSMQGGCTCENCCLLRVGTGNVELTALFAPKPQAMTAANDWTRAMMTDGYPELKKLYGMLGAEDHVQCTSLTHFPHNYNYVTRALMYSWFNKHLELGLEEPIVEDRWQPLTAAEWTVWNDKHPPPPGGASHEREVTHWLAADADRQLLRLFPKNAEAWGQYRKIVGGAFATLIPREIPSSGSITREKVSKEAGDGYLFFKDILRYPEQGEELPVVSFYPTDTAWNGQVVIWVDELGKRGTLAADGGPSPAVRRLLGHGFSVLAADLLYQGEFLPDRGTLDQTPVVANPREFAGYTFGYNHTVFAERVHDILTLLSFARFDEHEVEHVHLLGVGAAGPLVAAARIRAGDAVHRAAVQSGGFRFGKLRSYRDPNFLPGAVKYGDLPGMLALSAPHPLWVGGVADQLPSVVSAAFQVADAADEVTAHQGMGEDALLAAIDWLAED